MKNKIIEIPVTEFKNLMKRVDMYKNKISDLEKKITYLNDEISSYNKQFTSGKNDD